MRETNVEKRGSVRLIELNYAGDGGDRVPAYLLIPPGNGPVSRDHLGPLAAERLAARQ